MQFIADNVDQNVVTLDGKRKTASSLDRRPTSINMQAAAFDFPLCKDKQC